MARLLGTLLLFALLSGAQATQASTLSASEGDLTRLSLSPDSEGSPAWSGPSTLIYVTPSGISRVDVAAVGPKAPKEFQGRTWVFDPSSLEAATTSLRAYSPTQGTLEAITEVAAHPAIANLAAISKHRSASPDLWVVLPDGAARPLYAEPTSEAAPAWNPDGKAIWLVSQGKILRVDAATGVAREVKAVALTLNIEEYRDPVPNPDGTLVAFAGRVVGETAHDLWVMGPEGQNPRRLTQSSTGEARPSWFPDGKRLALQVDNGLALIHADGSGLQVITTSPDLGKMSRPAVSPDGKSVAFVSGFAGSDDIWLLRLPGASAPSPPPSAGASVPPPKAASAPPATPSPKQPGFEAALALAALCCATLFALRWRSRDE